tara:strand:- start:1305 stop:1610 length:306 start_codon:yes stop_codon:yes gene_type:complete
MLILLSQILMLLYTIISFYIWLLIAQAILSWLVAFSIVNTQNKLIYLIGDFLYKITEPALKPIRKLLPDFGGIDVSPVILIIILIFFRDLLYNYALSINLS